MGVVTSQLIAIMRIPLFVSLLLHISTRADFSDCEDLLKVLFN
jgi:hypothetical protein